MRKSLLKILTVGLTFLAPLVANGERYTISDVKGNVTVKRADRWNKVKKSAILSDTDILRLGGKSSITLVDGVSHLRVLTESGENSVATMVGKIDEQSIFGRGMKTIFSHSTGGRGQHGAGVRDMEPVSHAATEAVFAAIKEFGAGAAMDAQSPLRLSKVKQKKGRYCFAVTNAAQDSMYFNVVHSGFDGKPSLVYTLPQSIDCLVVAPGETVELDFATFVESPGRYAVVGCVQPFSSYDIALYLQEGQDVLAPHADWPKVIFSGVL